MDFLALALALVIGLATGIVVGALGAGGGILAVPVLVYLLGQEPHAAAASSLVIVALTAIVSLRHHARAGNIDWRAGGVFGAVSVVGAVAGSRLSLLVPSPLLMLLFGAMLAAVTVVMARSGILARRREAAARRPATSEPPSASRQADAVAARRADPVAARPAEPSAAAEGIAVPMPPRASPSWPQLIAAATATGLLTGFFGVGGGFIVVPMLVLLGLAMRRASGTSLLIMIIASAVSLLARIGTPVVIDWRITLLFAGAAMLGGLLGGPLSAKARPSTLTLCFAALLGAVAIGTLIEVLAVG